MNRPLPTLADADCRAGDRSRPRAAFTLVELLVVIGIIALLIAILLPALTKARRSAEVITCASNVRQLMLAFRMFANDHNGSLPGAYTLRDKEKFPEWKGDWLFGMKDTSPNPGGYDQAPQSGTIWPYMNENYKVYRCPAREVFPAGSGGGSNGRYDYAFFQIFSGAKIFKIKPESQFERPKGSGRLERNLTPIIVEEDPNFGINKGNIEGGHANTDKIAHTHRTANGDGSNFASLDGSVHFFVEPPESDCHQWYSTTPSGKIPPDPATNLGDSLTKFGDWNSK